MNIGSLDKRVTLQQPGTAKDELGQVTAPFVDVATVWANVRYNSGAESTKAGADTSVTAASIRIRYRADVTRAWRAVEGTTVFEIKAVLPNRRQGYADLVCEVVK